MDELARRVAALETRGDGSAGVRSDLRVIEMQLARAEEKIVRMGRGASSTRPGFPLRLTPESS